MHDLPKSTSISRDQSQFILGGGMLKCTSVGQICRCSVSSVGDDDTTTCSFGRMCFIISFPDFAKHLSVSFLLL
jgi:hypothetical protein